MKNLIASIIATSTFINTPKSFVNSNTETSNIEKQNNQVKHGKNGEDGLNGGNGGNGGAGWLRGGNGGNGGNAVDSSVNPSPECTEQNVDELEYSALKEMCRQVIFTTISKSYDPLNHACVYPT